MDDPYPEGMVKEIESVLREDYRQPAWKDIYENVFNSPLMFPLQRPREMSRMIQIARSIEPKTIMEIGSDKAGGLYHWCRSIEGVERIIACEVRGTPYSKVFEKRFPNLKFLWLPCSSYETGSIAATSFFMANANRGQTNDNRAIAKTSSKRGIDVLFIDGDKSAFEKDFDCYLPLMNRDGIVFMHDIQDDAPKAAFDKVVRRGYSHLRIIDKEDWHESEKRRMDDIAVASAHEGWLRHWEGKSCGVGVIFLGQVPDGINA